MDSSLTQPKIGRLGSIGTTGTVGLDISITQSKMGRPGSMGSIGTTGTVGLDASMSSSVRSFEADKLEESITAYEIARPKRSEHITRRSLSTTGSLPTIGSQIMANFDDEDEVEGEEYAPRWETARMGSSIRRGAWEVTCKPHPLMKQAALSDLWQTQDSFKTNKGRSVQSMFKEFQAEQESKASQGLVAAEINQVFTHSLTGYKHMSRNQQSEDRYTVHKLVFPQPDPHIMQELEVEDFDHEPFSLFAVFDGHGGAGCSQYLSENVGDLMSRDPVMYDEDLTNFQKRAIAVTSVFHTMEDTFCEWAQDSKDLSGSTAILACYEKGVLVMGGIGDSEAMFCDHEGVVSELCPRHVTSNPTERDRILALGGEIIDGRVGGIMMPTRALGDLDVKQSLGDRILSPIPELAFAGVYSKPKGSKKVQDPFLVLASDGVWDVMSHRSVAAIVKKGLARQKKEPTTNPGRMVANHAVKLGSKDDITVLVITFK